MESLVHIRMAFALQRCLSLSGAPAAGVETLPGASLCSEAGFIPGCWCGSGDLGPKFISVSCSLLQRGWGEAAEDSKERPGTFPSRQGVGCSRGAQGAPLFTGLCSPAGLSAGARFPKEVGVGKRLGSPDVIRSA